MSAPLLPLAFISFPGGPEWIVILAIGLLIFGKRLPEVGKSLGRSIVEFKKGLKGVEEEINRAGDDQTDMLPPPESSESGKSSRASTSEKEEAREKDTVSSK